MAAALRYLSELLHPQTADKHPAQAVHEAVADLAERITPTEQIASYRAMADTLGWDRRIKYGVLLRGLDELRKFKVPLIRRNSSCWLTNTC